MTKILDGGCKFAIGAARNGAVVGDAGGREALQRWDAERLGNDAGRLYIHPLSLREAQRFVEFGHRHRGRVSCSLLLGAAWRASRAMGYKRLITYTLPSEGGASLRAAGFRFIGQTKAQDWHRESRPRVRQAHEIKDIWERAS